MGDPASFFTTYAPTAKKCQAQTGVLAAVILAQWAVETSYGASLTWPGYEWNFAGIGIDNAGDTNGFPSRTAGIAAYIENLNASTYVEVRTAKTWQSQAEALGASRWAASHYELAGKGPGSQLVTIIVTFNLTQYDGGAGGAQAVHPTGTSSVTGGATGFESAQAAFLGAYGTVAPIPTGFGSTASTGDIVINGTSLAEIVGDAVVTVQLTLSLTKSSSLTLTVHDPTRQVLKQGIFSQQDTLTFGTSTWVLQGIEKSGSVLTCTFIPYVVYALEQASGAFTVHPGQMTRTDFARLLVSQIDGAQFAQATLAFLSAQKEGYAHTSKEQLSRGTVDNPLENSWTCLQRLASEIQWVCFECLGTVYFGPYSYLAQQTPAFAPHEFTDGVTTITGTFTTGQPTGELTITCTADSWTPLPGQAVAIGTELGPFAGSWIVSELTREDVEEPTITVTCMQPQPGLPEPLSGGTNPAVGSGAGNIQSTGGRKNAEAALAFALSKVGHPYSETVRLRLGPTYYDCSGLVYEAYLSVGVNIGTTTFSQWPNGAGEHVPAGISNLEPGDLLYFGYPPYSSRETAQHVAMVVSVTAKRGTVKVVEAADPTQGVIVTDFVNPTVGAYYGSTLVYLGAMRPAP